MMKKKELGDFQTPHELAALIIGLLQKKDFKPDTVIEPTCGKGSILLEAHRAFSPSKTLGIEIQKEYADSINQNGVEILNKDFFLAMDDIRDFVSASESILFVGNPPWVTNSELSAMGSENLPSKSNFDKIRGIEAITGKSNFDISEYIIKILIDNFFCRKSIYAFLCKISVAKKIMSRLWKNDFKYKSAEIYPIDSKKYFGAAVDSCLFCLDCTEKKANSELVVFESAEKPTKKRTSGIFKNVYFEDLSKKSTLKIFGKSQFVWRNGVKHDCAKVMELTATSAGLKNGYNELIDIEDALVFPYFKSSDLVKEKSDTEKRILVTQKFISEPTDYIRKLYPKTWKYLTDHTKDFEKRKSIIYKNKCAYSIFSVGDYTFKPYKIAISGLYKSLNFKLISPISKKTVLVDDTCNFISFDTSEKAEFVFDLLKTEEAINYLNARISWESKRPIKTEILNSIDFEALAKIKNKEDSFHYLFSDLKSDTLLF